MIWKILGSLFLIKYGISLSKFMWLMTRLYLLPSLGFRKDLKKYGAWAGMYGIMKGPLPGATPTESDQIRPIPTKSDQIRPN